MNQFCATYLFTKGDPSLISSTFKKSSFLKPMLLPNFTFDVIYTGNKKIVIKIIFRWCLNRYYSMILSRCYYKSSSFLLSVLKGQLFLSLNFFWLFKLIQSSFGSVLLQKELKSVILNCAHCTKLRRITRPRLAIRKIFDIRPLFGVE